VRQRGTKGGVDCFTLLSQEGDVNENGRDLRTLSGEHLANSAGKNRKKARINGEELAENEERGAWTDNDRKT